MGLIRFRRAFVVPSRAFLKKLNDLHWDGSLYELFWFRAILNNIAVIGVSIPISLNLYHFT